MNKINKDIVKLILSNELDKITVDEFIDIFADRIAARQGAKETQFEWLSFMEYLKLLEDEVLYRVKAKLISKVNENE